MPKSDFPLRTTSLNARLGVHEKEAMVGLLSKMGDAIVSMEDDIRQMNDFLKVITLNQIKVQTHDGNAGIQL